MDETRTICMRKDSGLLHTNTVTDLGFLEGVTLGNEQVIIEGVWANGRRDVSVCMLGRWHD